MKRREGWATYQGVQTGRADPDTEAQSYGGGRASVQSALLLQQGCQVTSNTQVLPVPKPLLPYTFDGNQTKASDHGLGGLGSRGTSAATQAPRLRRAHTWFKFLPSPS